MPNKHNKKRANKKRSSKSSSPANSHNAAASSNLLIESWQARDVLYQQVFGQHAYVSPKHYAPPKKQTRADSDAAKTAEFKITNSPDEAKEQELAIFTYAPDPLRPYWTYITAGLSTPWLQNEALEVSGFGLELMVKSPVEAEWPAQILRTMAYYIFNHMGTLSPGKRLALNSSIIAGGESLLRNVLIWYTDEAPDGWYQLPSGGFGIFTAIGVTDDEMRLTEDVHQEYGTWCMVQILKRLGLDQVTDPRRASIFARENITSIIDSVKDYAEQFHQAFPAANELRGEGHNEQN